MRRTRYIWWGIGLVLAAGIVVQLLPRSQPVVAGHSNLALLPKEGAGWTTTELPLGPTEAVSAATADVLRYDEVVYRQYKSAQGDFSVYAAYWGPGNMPVQLVASHTPDRCWTSAGWKCTTQDYAYRVTGVPTPLRQGQGRIFAAENTPEQHVVYWHLVGPELYDYGERLNTVPSAWKWWRDSARQVFHAPPEQYFIRISSDREIGQLSTTPAFQAVAVALGKLGLAER